MSQQPERPTLDPSTVAIAAGRPERIPGGPINVGVSLSSMYHAGGRASYARETNPSWAAFEDTMGALEGGSALLFSSGMAAFSAVVEELPGGAVIVAPADAYTGTRAYLADAVRRDRFTVRLVDVADTERTLAACDGADLLWVESPTNPLLAIADLPGLAAGTRGTSTLLAVDNTFATPLLQRPLDLGADVVVYSATKFLAGHSDVLGGVTVTRDSDLAARLMLRRELLGSVAGPMEAFLALRGLRTLPLRIERSQASAQVVAERLQRHPAVSRVRYPGLPGDRGYARARAQMRGFGAIVSFELAAGPDAAERLCAGVRLATHATSLGGVESTMERRRRHRQPSWPSAELREAGRQLVVPESLVRMSVGCEHVDDLWNDLEQALADL